MSFTDESALEAHVRNLITRICSRHTNLQLFQSKKAVDILVCRNGANSALFFVEVKYHKKSHGRLGFGSSKGGGFQPEIVSTAPDYFESNLRWIIGSDEFKGVLFERSATIRQYVAGGVVGDKFNNIQSRIFKDLNGLSDDQLETALEQWFISDPR